MYAKSMAGNSPMLGWAASRWEFVSPRSRRPSGRGPVLCIWPPDDRVLEFAEDLAFGTALCVIRAYVYDIAAWIERTDARPLAQGYEDGEKPALSEEITRLLDSSLFFGGSNGFVGGGEKEHLITRLREIAARSDCPSAEEIADNMRASGETHAKGIERARKWYQEILEGKRHRDYRRRLID